MGFWLHMLVAFIIFFFLWKKHGVAFKQTVARIRDKSYSKSLDPFELIPTKEFVILVFVPLFWPITGPGYIIWSILEKIYNKFN